MELRPSLFWDTNVKTIDLQKHKAQIIERTMSRGRIEEVRALFGFYGRDIIKETMLTTRYLDKLTLALCSALFEKPITEFRCYKLAQLNPSHWDY
jgi:hypothetical protein